MALLGQLDPGCGFTALGDPLQAIYDWQLDESTSKTSSSDLLRRLTDDLGARRTSLDVDYRARGEDPHAVVALGDQVRRLDDGPEARELVASMSSTLLDLGPLTDVTNLLDRGPRTTAVLCRTNGQALVVSQALRHAGVRHVLRRQLVQSVSPPGWARRW